MPSIIVISDEGNIIFEETLNQTEPIIDKLREHDKFPEIFDTQSEVKIKSLIVFLEKVRKPEPFIPNLSVRQIDVLQLLSRGYSPDQIALELHLSMPTIRLHMTRLKEKFGTSSRDQMMAMAGQIGLCNPYEGFDSN